MYYKIYYTDKHTHVDSIQQSKIALVIKKENIYNLYTLPFKIALCANVWQLHVYIKKCRISLKDHFEMLVFNKCCLIQTCILFYKLIIKCELYKHQCADF